MNNCKMDNPDLLKIMLEDTRKSSNIYKPTNYWKVYEKRFLPEIEKFGLKDFRSRRGSVLSSFGATDIKPLYVVDLLRSIIFNNKYTRKIPYWNRALGALNVIINAIVKAIPCFWGYLKKRPYIHARSYGIINGAKSIETLDSSLLGNPEEFIICNKKAYTPSILNYYMRYSYCCRHINFDNINTFVELGSGVGMQIEVIRKLHPNICFFVFDIPPQLYVCEQYLKEVFPESVVSYVHTRGMETIPNIERGNIYICGNWKFPILKELDIDLFWNSASFQEMEPDVVANYLRYINKKARYVYLMERMSGKEVANQKGQHGVLEKTKLNHYGEGLSNFTCEDMRPAITPYMSKLTAFITSRFLRKSVNLYCDSFWRASGRIH